MADKNERIRDLVREELRKDPGAKTKELWSKAAAIDPSTAELDLRVFNGRYVLSVKREMAAERGENWSKRTKRASPSPKRQEPAPSSDGARDDVRAILLRFATEIVTADTRVAAVKVIAGIDTWVDQAVKAAGRGQLAPSIGQIKGV